MANVSTKAVLLEKMCQGYDAFTGRLSFLNEEQMVTPGVIGEWSIKDILVHLAVWQERIHKRFQAALQNRKSGLDLITNEEEMNRFNEQIVAENRGRSCKRCLGDLGSLVIIPHLLYSILQSQTHRAPLVGTPTVFRK